MKPFFSRSAFRVTLLYAGPFAVVIIGLALALMMWEIRQHEREQVSELLEVSRAFSEQILITRQWNASHGGVYVEITNRTQPNPYLKDPERDIVSTAGRRYTKINPAYMTRQLAEIAAERGRYKFRMVSLSPINPYNSADEWEAQALRQLQQGAREAYAFLGQGEERGFHYMAPLRIERPCLRCHRQGHYELGAVAGGLHITIPTRVSDILHRAETRRMVLSYAAVVVVAILFVFGLSWAFSARLVRAARRELEAEKLKTAVELSGAMAHELRQPLTIIVGFAELLKDKVKGSSAEQEADIIVGQAMRMDETIKKMLEITVYRTKPYSEDVEILDLEASSEEEK
jgi:signal transduction histidine kinase